MTSSERVKKLIRGEPVDRVGIAGWMHMPLVDQNVDDFTKATISFTDRNNWDFIKLMYHGFYFCKAYGAEIRYSVDPKVARAEITRYPVSHPRDYLALKPLDIMKTSFRDDLELTKRVLDHYRGQRPVLGTLFTPLTFAQELYAASRPSVIQGMMKYSPDELKAGLEAITETCVRFAEELVKIGVDGIFYATQFGSRDLISDAEHEEFGRPYDLKVLDVVKDKCWFNLFHIHGSSNLMLEKYVDYPVQAFNFEHMGPTPESSLTFKKARSLTDKLLIGGINQFTDFLTPNNDRAAVKELLRTRLREALEGCGDRKFVFAPGCGFELQEDPYLYGLLEEVAEEETR